MTPDRVTVPTLQGSSIALPRRIEATGFDIDKSDAARNFDSPFLKWRSDIGAFQISKDDRELTIKP